LHQVKVIAQKKPDRTEQSGFSEETSLQALCQ